MQCNAMQCNTKTAWQRGREEICVLAIFPGDKTEFLYTDARGVSVSSGMSLRSPFRTFLAADDLACMTGLSAVV